MQVLLAPGQRGHSWLLWAGPSSSALMGYPPSLQLVRPPSTCPLLPQTLMAQLADPSATGLGGQKAFNETVEAEHLGPAGWTKGTAAAEPGRGDRQALESEGKAGGRVRTGRNDVTPGPESETVMLSILRGDSSWSPL